ncbi:unnamed protein product [Aphanomyces euteiches]
MAMIDVAPPSPTTSDEGVTMCFFNGCTNPAKPDDWRCTFHRARSRCQVAGCNSQVYARHLCVKHGGKKTCQVAGCERNVRLGTLCTRHAGPIVKKRCQEPNCPNLAHNFNKCVRHGGGRKCKFGGCLTHARSGGYCCRHTRIVKENAEKESASSETSDENEKSMLQVMDEVIEPLAWSTSIKMEQDIMDLAPIDWNSALDDILVKTTEWTNLFGGLDELWC